MKSSFWLTVSEKEFLSKIDNLFLIDKIETERQRIYLYQYLTEKEITPNFIEYLGEPIILLKSSEKKRKQFREACYNWQMSLNKREQEIFFFTSQKRNEQKAAFTSRRDCLRDLKQFIFFRLDILENRFNLSNKENQQEHFPSE